MLTQHCWQGTAYGEKKKNAGEIFHFKGCAKWRFTICCFLFQYLFTCVCKLGLIIITFKTYDYFFQNSLLGFPPSKALRLNVNVKTLFETQNQNVQFKGNPGKEPNSHTRHRVVAGETHLARNVTSDGIKLIFLRCVAVAACSEEECADCALLAMSPHGGMQRAGHWHWSGNKCAIFTMSCSGTITLNYQAITDWSSKHLTLYFYPLLIGGVFHYVKPSLYIF